MWKIGHHEKTAEVFFQFPLLWIFLRLARFMRFFLSLCSSFVAVYEKDV